MPVVIPLLNQTLTVINVVKKNVLCKNTISRNNNISQINYICGNLIKVTDYEKIFYAQSPCPSFDGNYF